jgi:ribosomal protein L28
MNAKVELKKFMKTQKEKGVKRYEMALVLFGKGYSESQVGKVMGVHPKTAHAFKINLSKSGRAIAAKKGKRVHIDPSTAKLKRIDGHKTTAQFFSLAEAVLK